MTTAYSTVLERNIRAARSRSRLGQRELASRMRALGYAWHQQTVANVENGKRRLFAEEIAAVAAALQVSVGALMRPADADGIVTFPAGQPVSPAFRQGIEPAA